MPRQARHNCILIIEYYMGSTIIKSTFGILILIVLSFFVGIAAADDIKSSLLLVIGLVSLSAVVIMGKRVWYALFLLTPICQVMPTFSTIPMEHLLSAAVLGYWCLLCIMGHARFIWRKHFACDFFAAVFLILMAISFFRAPVSVSVLNSLLNIKGETIGGKAYIHTIFFLASYLCYSCIPFEKKTLLKLLKWNLIISLLSFFIFGVYEFAKDFSFSESRYSMFIRFSNTLLVAICCSAPFWKLITSPVAIFGIIISASSSLFSGFRSALAGQCLYAVSCFLIKREYHAILFACFFGITALFVLQVSNTTQHLPYIVQRVLSPISFLKVNEEARRDGEGSSDWRVTMWKWALDPRMKYIKNYVIGDGFALHATTMARYMRAEQKRTIEYGNQQAFAYRRIWHSGFIDTLQGLGWVGVTFVLCFLLFALITAYRINSALRDTPFFMYSMLYTYTSITGLTFFISVYTVSTFITTYLILLGPFKLFYSIAVEEGKFVPKKKKYIPKLIQDVHFENT